MISVTNTSLSQEIIARYTNFFSAVPSQAQMVLLEQMPTMPQEQAAPRRIVQEIYQIENCLEQNTLLHLHFHLQFLDRLVQGATQKLLDTVQRDVQMRQHSLALTRQENQTKVDVSQTRRLLEQALRNTSPVFQRDQQQSARYADQLRQTLAPVLLPAVGPVEVIYPSPDQSSQLPVVRAIESGSSLLLEGYPQVSTVQTRGDIPLTLTHREESVSEGSASQQTPSRRVQTSQQPPVSRESRDHEPQRGQSTWEALREPSREALRPFPRAEEPQSKETIQTRGDTPLTLTHREEAVPGEVVSQQQQVGPSRRMQTSQQPPVSRESRDREPQRGQSPWEGSRESSQESSREALRPFPRVEEPQSKETIQTRTRDLVSLTHREESVSEGSASQQTPSRRVQTSQQPPVSRESRDHEPQRGQSTWEALREPSRAALRPFPRAEEPQSKETIQTRGDTPLTLTHREEAVPGEVVSQQQQVGPSRRMQTSQQPPVSRESRDHEPREGRVHGRLYGELPGKFPVKPFVPSQGQRNRSQRRPSRPEGTLPSL